MTCPYCNSKNWVHNTLREKITEPFDGGYTEYSYALCSDCGRSFVTRDVYNVIEKGTIMTLDAFKVRGLSDMVKKSACRVAVIEKDMETGMDVDKGSCPYCGSRNGYTDAHVADSDSDGLLFAEWLFARCKDCDHEVFVREVYVSSTNTLEYKIMNMEDPNDS